VKNIANYKSPQTVLCSIPVKVAWAYNVIVLQIHPLLPIGKLRHITNDTVKWLLHLATIAFSLCSSLHLIRFYSAIVNSYRRFQWSHGLRYNLYCVNTLLIMLYVGRLFNTPVS
jgi:hypothetical protein